MFEGFDQLTMPTTNSHVFTRFGGAGPALLLVHGYPQTHVMWHKIAPILAEHFTVVCPDLRGYGESGKPPSDPIHAPYSKRAMAQDLAELMTYLGHERFMVAGHDRGGRVTHRMCLDHADRITRAAVLDIVPTRTIYEATNQGIATGYYHWFFLIQPEPLPERLIGADPAFYLEKKMGQWSSGDGVAAFSPEAMAAYQDAFCRPETIHSTCEDYRAAASIDLDHDKADEDARIACPLLVLWGMSGLMERYFDVLACWREKAANSVEGKALECGHFLAEEAPQETMELMLKFFASEHAP